jgi:glycosyltransferase involved in cell wall biosynthesis
VDALGLHAAVAFLGHVARPALDAHLGAAWVQAVPSTYPEPSANVIPEAMMRGTAVVATDVGGSPEAVVNGTTGFLVRARDAGDLAARLLEVVRDRPLAERMGAAGRRVALERLSTEGMLDRIEAIYEHLVPVAERQQSKND